MREWLKRNYKHILAFGIAAGFIFVTWWKMGIFYQTNDDRYMAELLSGAATGKEEAHLIYINYLLALPLSWLYKISTAVPWYGLCLLLLVGIAFYVLFDSALSKAQKWPEVLGVLGSVGVLYLLHMYLLAQIQYTCVASLLALAGFAAVLLYHNRKAGFIVFATLELLAYLLRSQAMLMVALPGLTVLVSALLLKENMSLREKVQKFLVIAGAMVAVLFVGLIGNFIGYGGKDWKAFQEFNDARTVLFDYYEMPPYEEVQHILEKYDVERVEYEALSSYVILRWDVSPRCMTELAEYVKEHTPGAESAIVTDEIHRILFEEKYWKICDVLLILCIGALVWALLPGNRRMLLSLAGVLGTSYAVLFYLIWRGRYPLHVVLPLIVCVIYFLLMLIWNSYFEVTQTRRKRLYGIMLVGLGLICAYKSYSIGQEQYRDIKDLHRNETIYIQGLKEITEYCNDREEQKFLIDIFAMMYYNGEVLDTDLYQEKNYRLTGSWFANTPYYLESLTEYLGDSRDGIYLIVNSGEGFMDRPVVTYLSEVMGCEAKHVDSFAASHGGTYEVIHFEGIYEVQ